jgi:hypothetical protein
MRAGTNVVDLAALKKSLGQALTRRNQRQRRKKGSGRARADQAASGSIGQTEASLSQVVFIPAQQPNEPAFLLRADHTMDLSLGGEVSDLVVAKATLGTLEAK